MIVVIVVSMSNKYMILYSRILSTHLLASHVKIWWWERSL